MNAAQVRNLGFYALWAFLGAFVATGLSLAQQLSGTDVIAVRALAATFTTSFFGSLATVAGASQLTRLGSEQIAAQVNALKADGVPRSEMVVLSQDDAAAVLATDRTAPGTLPALSDADIDRLARRGLELMHEDRVRDVPAASLVTQEPHWLPDKGRPS